MKDSVDSILQRVPVASLLNSAEWNTVAPELRARAFFSSQVTEMRILHELKQGVLEAAKGAKSPSEFRRDIRALLDMIGYSAGDAEGTVKDLRTKTRLDLILNINVQQARGYAQWREATSAGALAAFPAYELVRVRNRLRKRDWHSRWAAAGGKLFGGRMIALKTDPIWTRISVFGNPYPPFDYNSGMGIADVGRKECLALGVIDEATPTQQTPNASFNKGLSSKVPFDGDSAEFNRLKAMFGDQIEMVNGEIRWRNK